MSAFQLKHLLAGAAMLAAAAGAVALKPTVHMADQHPINLEQMIPQQFGDWKLDKTIVPIQVDPEIQAKLNQIYSQVLTRTYIDPAGHRIMLSVAYGGDQSDGMRAHRPEICFPAQGFQVAGQALGTMRTEFGPIPVKRMVATKGERIEPITYWIMVGERAARTSSEQKTAQLHYGLHGQIPDGMIVRVSTIAADAEPAFQLEDSFVNTMLRALKPADRSRLAAAVAG